MRTPALMLVLLASPVVAAQPSEAERAAAQALLDQGYARYEAGDFLSAADAFRAAQKIVADPLNLRNTARAYEKAGRALLALRFYDEHLDSDDAEPRRQRSRVDRERLAATALGVLAIECAPAATTVTVERLGTSVLDGPTLGDARSCPVRHVGLEPGQYQARFEAPGHAPVEQTFLVTAAQTTAHREQLVAVARAAPEAPARPLAWGLCIGGAVAVVGGAVAHALNVTNHAALEDSPADEGLRDTVDATAIGAITGYSVGAAALGVGLYLLLRPVDAEASVKLGAAPGGLVLSW